VVVPTFNTDSFDDLDFQSHPNFSAGVQAIATYPNGYGASVVRFSGSYGYEQGLYEVGILAVQGDGFNLDYSTRLGNDVIGHCSPERVTEILREVAALPSKEVAMA